MGGWEGVPGVQANVPQVINLGPVHSDIVSSQDTLCAGGHSCRGPLVPDEAANGCVQPIITCAQVIQQCSASSVRGILHHSVMPQII